MDKCTSSDDRLTCPLPPIESFTIPLDSEERPSSSTKDIVSLTGKRRPIKIHIGWMHRVGEKYRQVRRKYGGGTRELILDNLNIYPLELVQRAITLFFPNRWSQVISIEEVETFALGNFCGEELEHFSDEHGRECSLGQYLKAQGTYASRCYIYLLTKKRSVPMTTKVSSASRKRSNKSQSVQRDTGGLRTISECPKPCKEVKPSTDCVYQSNYTEKYPLFRLIPTDKLGFINLDQPSITVMYCFNLNSPFSRVVDADIDFTRKDCLDFALFRSPSVDIVDFEPTNHDFIVQHIQIDDNVFVTTSYEDMPSFVFPNCEDTNLCILHSPSEVWGYDGEELIIGIVASCHGTDNPMYTWYRNDTVYQAGIHLCCVTASLPGIYFCKVSCGTSYDISKPIQIVEFSESTFKKQKVEPLSDDTDRYPNSTEANWNILPSVDHESLRVDFTSKACNGIFGSVYKATWQGIDVHVELLNMCEMESDRTELLASIREVNSRIRYPNILSILALVDNGAQISLVSEYHEGVTLDALVFSSETRQLFTLNTKHKYNIALQICQALVYLHGLCPPIVHRAVCPISIWIMQQGSLAKLCSPNIRSSSALEDTLVYQAPECLISNQDGDVGADVWGMGAALTVLFTEMALWGDTDHVTSISDYVIEKMEHGCSPIALQHLPTLKEILTACLNIDPGLRPSSGQLLATLRHHCM